MTTRSGLQEQKPQLGASCGRWRSTVSICELFSRQMTTFHPALRHHPPEMEAMSLLMRDWPHLFFEPRSKCLPTDTEHAGNTSHAGAFMICTEYFFLFFLCFSAGEDVAPHIYCSLCTNTAAVPERYARSSRCSRCHSSGNVECVSLVSLQYINSSLAILPSPIILYRYSYNFKSMLTYRHQWGVAMAEKFDGLSDADWKLLEDIPPENKKMKDVYFH